MQHMNGKYQGAAMGRSCSKSGQVLKRDTTSRGGRTEDNVRRDHHVNVE